MSTAASNSQPRDATLTAWGGLTFAADQIGYAFGPDQFTTTAFTAAARSLLDDTTTAAMLTTLGGVGAGSANTFTAANVFETGATGGTPVKFRQTGGVAGTDEIQIGHTGARGLIDCKDGNLALKSSATGQIDFDYFGTVYVEIGSGGLKLYDAPTAYAISNLDTRTGTYGWNMSAQGQVVGSTYAMKWMTGTNWFTGAVDLRLRRSAAKTMTVDDGAAGAAALVVTGAVTAASINLGGATLLDVLHASKTIDFASIAAGATATDTITVTGAVAGDTVDVGPPAAVEAGLAWEAVVTAADTVTLRVRNPTAGAIDPASGLWKVTVLRI